MTIGGIVSTVRTIVTKTGSKMAFVGIEDKSSESEIIVFPNLFSEIGAKLVQDAVIRAEGKVNARDRDGNLTSEVKLIADEINFVTDKELREYESTGRTMQAPKPRKGGPVKVTKKAADKKSAPAAVEYVPHMPVLRKLFVHIKNPDDAESLMQLKQICAKFPGSSDIVLVLGTEKKSAIRLPFKVDDSDNLVNQLVSQLGEDAVIIK